MSQTLQIEDAPQALGLDAARLARIRLNFSRYVDDGQLPGWLVLLSRRGRIAYLDTYGWRDREAGLPIDGGTRFRIYSMTKPITSVAALICYEQGAFDLTDPVSRFIPAFADMRVWQGGSAEAPLTAPAEEPIRLWHLLTHTAGLTYGVESHPVDALYREQMQKAVSEDWDLAAACDRLAQFPLLFEPGTDWHYSMATDVLGRVVEVVSGRPLDQFLADEIFTPLGMRATGFWVPESERPQLAALYRRDPDRNRAVRDDVTGARVATPHAFLSGGGGLVSTAGDYYRFMRMLLGEGELDGTRVLGSRTVRFMTRNHLPAPLSLASFGQPGVGFGLGVAVQQDPVAHRSPENPGAYGWGGVASTDFWVDPREQLAVLFLTQLIPSGSYPLRPRLRQLVYQALVD